MTSKVGPQGSLQFVALARCAGSLQVASSAQSHWRQVGTTKDKTGERGSPGWGAGTGSRPLKALCAPRSFLSRFRQHWLVEWLTNHVPGVQLFHVTEG